MAIPSPGDDSHLRSAFSPTTATRKLPWPLHAEQMESNETNSTFCLYVFEEAECEGE